MEIAAYRQHAYIHKCHQPEILDTEFVTSDAMGITGTKKVIFQETE
jgi:hypothetical protein